jgi:hypothetical protein
MNQRCTFVESDGFHHCGSYAFNLQRDGIDQGTLCDVHYWQARVAELEEKQHRTEQALSISHRTTDNYREALVRIKEGRYTDEADIGNIAFHALNPPSMHPGDYLKPRD